MTQWFDPEPTFKAIVRKELVSRGFEVELITGFPNYPRKIVRWLSYEINQKRSN